ncbi:MAG: hypothetical protein ACX98W_01210 [bacterium]
MSSTSSRPGRRGRLPGIALCLSTWVIACASPGPKHEYELAPGKGFGPHLDSALVIPINQTVPIPAGLEKGEGAVSSILIEYLEEKGLEVTPLEPREYRRVLVQAAHRLEQEMLSGATGSVSATPTFSEVIPHLLARLELDVDLVVVPNMVLREAELVGRGTARWDGVRRRKRGALSFASLTGRENAASLQVVLYDREGARLFTGYGGLDLLFEINMQKRAQQLMESRLEDPEDLREGVCVAFHPFFGEAERC